MQRTNERTLSASRKLEIMKDTQIERERVTLFHFHSLFLSPTYTHSSLESKDIVCATRC